MAENQKNENEHITHWESLSTEDVLKKLDVSEHGLTKDIVEKRREEFGANKLPEAKEDTALKRFLMQFNNALIYVLLVASILTMVLQHWLDTFVIIGVVIINALIGYIQEDKAKKALDSIRYMLAPKSIVVRDGKRKDIGAEELVPGDIVLIKTGDKVPADIRLLKVNRLQVEEASLTGESDAVSKKIEPVDAGTVLGERKSMIYMGTTVQAGDATGVVVATGKHTELGKINTMLSETQAITTPLIRKINSFGKKLSYIIIAIGILLFAYGFAIANMPIQDSLLSVIGLAVAAIPEGLPAILTITLAIGVRRMSTRKAIIRRLPSVETLGAVTVICSDKTGTLTRNEMTAVSVETADASFKVKGSGYDPEGHIVLDDDTSKEEVDTNQYMALKRFLHVATLCNVAELVEDERGQWRVLGSPTEGALKALGLKGNMGDLDQSQLDGVPFDSEYKYRITLNRIEKERAILVSGAPDRLIALCQEQMKSDGQTEPIDADLWDKKIAFRADQGQRMLGCAIKLVDDTHERVGHEDLKEGLIFLGVSGIIDPPRPEAIEAVRVCKKAGITVKMITGDHLLTAKSIGRAMGIDDGQIALSGADLENMSDSELQEAVKTCNIFARTSPEHKLKLVNALQANGEICAMTGDGVNDAPALKKADIGIAMGIKGTEVTKDAAAMVLADDNFASIASAVEEGRTIYDNLRKTLLFMLPTNCAEALVILVAMIFSLSMPITPVQILWVNMVTAVTLGIALAFEPSESNVLSRAPLDPKASIIGLYFGFRILFVSVIVGALTFLSFVLLKGQGEEFARTVAINTLVFGELFYLFNCRKIHETVIGKSLITNKIALLVAAILLVIQVGFTYLPFMNILFGTVPIGLGDWSYSIVAGLIVFFIVEIEKKLTVGFREKYDVF